MWYNQVWQDNDYDTKQPDRQDHAQRGSKQDTINM